jgi:hypothetical protein
MSFYLRNDTEQWFTHIKDQKPYIETKFDLFYFCSMLGIAAGRKSSITGRSEANEIVKYFVKSYLPVQKLIIGLLIKAELRRLGINAAEKDQVYALLNEIVDPDSPTKLTEAGLTKLNEYASGGYDVLSEELPTKPYSVEDFLRTYTALLRNKASASRND